LTIFMSVDLSAPFSPQMTCTAARRKLMLMSVRARTPGPALGAALILHQRMFSVDERAAFPKGGTGGLIRMTSV
jgi:hypothetical protein